MALYRNYEKTTDDAFYWTGHINVYCRNVAGENRFLIPLEKLSDREKEIITNEIMSGKMKGAFHSFDIPSRRDLAISWHCCIEAMLDNRFVSFQNDLDEELKKTTIKRMLDEWYSYGVKYVKVNHRYDIEAILDDGQLDEDYFYGHGTVWMDGGSMTVDFAFLFGRKEATKDEFYWYPTERKFCHKDLIGCLEKVLDDCKDKAFWVVKYECENRPTKNKQEKDESELRFLYDLKDNNRQKELDVTESEEESSEDYSKEDLEKFMSFQKKHIDRFESIILASREKQIEESIREKKYTERRDQRIARYERYERMLKELGKDTN